MRARVLTLIVEAVPTSQQREHNNIARALPYGTYGLSAASGPASRIHTLRAA